MFFNKMIYYFKKDFNKIKYTICYLNNINIINNSNINKKNNSFNYIICNINTINLDTINKDKICNCDTIPTINNGKTPIDIKFY